MELRSLRYFLAIANEENFTRASNRLHVTQPALSRQIRELENEFGHPLFIRDKRRTTLTPEGQLLRQYAQSIVDLADKAETELSAKDAALSGTVDIGAAETSGFSLVAVELTAMQRDYPRVAFRLHTGMMPELLEGLDKGVLDFAVLQGVPDAQRYASLELPYRERWGACFRRDDPLAEKGALTADDLRSRALIVSRRAIEFGELRDWFGCGKSDLRIAASYDLAHNAAFFAHEKERYCLCLEHVVAPGEQPDLCFRPLSPEVWVSLFMVWRKQRVFSPVVRETLDRLKGKFA